MRIAGVLVAVLMFCAGPAGAAVDPALKCLSTELKAAADLTKGLLKCQARAARTGTPVDPSCTQRQDHLFNAQGVVDGRKIDLPVITPFKQGSKNVHDCDLREKRRRSD